MGRHKKPPFVPRWNYYRCDTCHRFLVTVDLAEGMTPGIMPCGGMNADNGRIRKCSGTLVSAAYPPISQWPVFAKRDAMAEFFVPDSNEFRRLSEAMKKNVRAGNLVMRSALVVHRFPEESDNA